MTQENIALEFFETWKETGVVERRLLSDDFAFFAASPLIDATVWFWNLAGGSFPRDGLVVVEMAVTDTHTAVLFEELDEVTLLTYRTGWFFTIQAGKIARVIEVRQSIHPLTVAGRQQG